MPKLVVMLAALFAASALFAQTKPAPVTLPAESEITPITWPQLKAYLETPKDKTVIVDFWATWCIPCVQALPAYAQLAAQRQDVQIVLVSFDENDADTRAAVRARLKAAGLHVGTFLVSDRAEQTKIVQQISPQWKDIVLPAAFVYDKSGKQTYVDVSGETHTAAQWQKIIK